MCVCVNQIKTANNAVCDLVFFVNLLMRWNGHVFFNSLNKMTNENARKRDQSVVTLIVEHSNSLKL